MSSEQDSLMQAMEQLRLLELVEQLTGVKLTPNINVDSYLHAYPQQQNLMAGVPQVPYAPEGAQLYGNYVPTHPVQAPGVSLMPQPQPVDLRGGSQGTFSYAPQVAAGPQLQVLDSQVADPVSREGSFVEQDIGKIKPFEPKKTSQNASKSSSFVQDSAGKQAGPGQNNFCSIFEEMQPEDINKYQRKDSNQSQKQSSQEFWKEPQDFLGSAHPNKQQAKSKSGVVTNQKLGSEGKGGEKQLGSATPGDRHVFRKKQKSEVGSIDATNDQNQQFLTIQQHAKQLQHEQRKLSKEARAREKKIM